MSKLTLDDAIKHCLDIADGQDKCAEISVSEHAKERISQCAADHRQLAEWLTELKEAKRLLKQAADDISVLLSENDSCYYCKHYVAGECLCVDDCNRSCEWHCTDDVKKLLNE